MRVRVRVFGFGFGFGLGFGEGSGSGLALGSGSVGCCSLLVASTPTTWVPSRRLSPLIRVRVRVAFQRKL